MPRWWATPVTRAYPVALAVRLPDGRVMLSRRLTAPVRRDVVAHLEGQRPGPSARTEDGDRYTTCPPGLLVEVLAGTTRHATATVTRVRGELVARGYMVRTPEGRTHMNEHALRMVERDRLPVRMIMKLNAQLVHAQNAPPISGLPA
ncbi:hypothetical protein [Streptomyces sp. NPDC048442]|uniref:hypothetical protein n=1 Tax=Streptomyces sp. NPDC048442 TaxID=3154823 RepID=UPI0034325072